VRDYVLLNGIFATKKRKKINYRLTNYVEMLEKQNKREQGLNKYIICRTI